MDHPKLIRPAEHAIYDASKMGKATLFQSPRLLAGLNAFEPDQEHALHAHTGTDKVYVVVEGSGEFLIEGAALAMREGEMLVAPAGVPHGIRNTGGRRLLVLAILAPGPGVAGTDSRIVP